MKFDPKYKVEGLIFNFEVIDALDFSDAPYLLLEKDSIGNRYLSYLLSNNFDEEIRAYVQISKRKFQALLSESISVRDIFKQPENNVVITGKLSLHTGRAVEYHIVPASDFDYNILPENYFIQYDEDNENIEDSNLIDQSIAAQKLIFDFYLHGQNLIESIKPYALFKVFNPIIEIIRDFVGFDNRNADKILSFSNLRHHSLGITIEVNYSKDMFLQKEDEALQLLTDLLNAESKENFQTLVGKTRTTKFIVQYKSIIKAIIENNADLHTSYANPITHEVQKSFIDKEKALKAKEVVDESFDIIEDIEEIIGIFLEIDINSKEPSFKILPSDDEKPIGGKFGLSIMDKLTRDVVNFGKEEYLFTIKTLYYPETIVKSEEIKRFMIDYQKKT